MLASLSKSVIHRHGTKNGLYEGMNCNLCHGGSGLSRTSESVADHKERSDGASD